VQNADFRDITKQILTVSLDQHWPEGNIAQTEGHNFSVLTSAPVNICIMPLIITQILLPQAHPIFHCNRHSPVERVA